MKHLMSLLPVLFFCQWSHAQTMLTGVVKDNAGNPVAGANIVIEGTYDGTSSDAGGAFRFESEATGDQVVVISFIGFRPFVTSVRLSGMPVGITAVLQEEISELNAVIISAGTYTASDESRRTIFTARDIASTAGATADIAGALNTLPGTQKVGETGRLFVRGGDGNETRTFIDGMLVLDPYNASAPNTPSRGRFLPFMFKGSSFSTGGYSAEYGQALSSALVLDSRDKADGTRTDFGLLSVGADVTHTHAWSKSSAAAKVQYTNLRPYFDLIEQETDWVEPPSSIEASATFRHATGKNGMVKIFGNINHSAFSLLQHDIDHDSNTWLYEEINDYAYINTTYKGAVGENWIVRSGVSFSNVKDNLTDTLRVLTHDRLIHAKTVFEGSVSDIVEIRTGAELVFRQVDENSGVADSPSRFDEKISSAFTEVDFHLTDRLVTRAGARAEYNSLFSSFSIDPRISLGYRPRDKGTFSLAFGTFSQSPETQYLLLQQQVQSEKARHYITSYQFESEGRIFRAEAYYKTYSDLIRYGDEDKMGLSNTGSGYSRGIELFWRDNRTLKNTDYWISYSFLDTERNYLNFPGWAMPTFASAHNFSAVYKYFFSRLKTQFGATYSFTSGRPYNDPNTPVFNGGRTPAYHDLSVNFAYLPTPQLIIYTSVTNVLGRENIFGYEYSDTSNEGGVFDRRAIRQPAPRFIFIGVFLTLSKDKNINQLPTL